MDASRTETLREHLRQAGLRVTRPRLAVLDLMHGIGGHRSVDEMVELLSDRDIVLPRASVYGIVDALVRAGLLSMADAGPGRALYELRGTPHHHFVCMVCGDVIDVPCSSEDLPCVETGDVEGTVRETQIIFRGECGECARGANLA